MTTGLSAPRAVRRLVESLEGAGHEAWAVGGAVRDALLGGQRADWDLATSATPAEMRRVFQRTIPIGIEHGTLGVFGEDGTLYEVTTFRRDVVPLGRKAIVEFADTLDEDLSRRDFTINAIAWHPIRDELKDPFGGRQDLEDRVLRAVGSAEERFREDYLRILRGLRFAGALDLTVAEDTWAGLVDCTPGLAGLSMERVREELLKVMDAGKPSRALSLYASSGALAMVAPELAQIDPGLLAVVDGVRPHRPILRVATLVAGGLGGGAEAAGVAKELLVRLRFSNREIDEVAAAVLGGLAPPSRLMDDAFERRRWIAALGVPHLASSFRIWRARCSVRGEGGEQLLRTIRAIRRDVTDGVPFAASELQISGRDLIDLGWRPGPEMGRALESLLHAVWRSEVTNDRQPLLDALDDLDEGEELHG